MPTTLEDLCEDVIEMIIESLDFRDIVNLRMTSKAISFKLLDAYRRMFRNSKLLRTGIAPISTSYHGLQMFHVLTAKEMIARSITSLRINLGRLTASAVRSSLADYRLSGVDGKLLDDPLSWDRVESGLTREGIAYMDTHEKYTEQEWATATGEDLKLFKGALARLPNLRKIYIGKFELPPDVYTHHSFFPLYTTGAGCRMHSAALSFLFEALAAHPAQLEALAIHREEGPWTTSDEAGIWALDIPRPIFAKLRSSLVTIRRLHLTLSAGEFAHHGPKTTFLRNLAPAGFTRDKGPRILLDFLAAMPRLSSLHLVAATDNEFSHGFVRKVLRGLPATLREIHLANMLASVRILAHFLNAHRHRLTAIGLTRLYLTDETWTPVLRMIDVYLPRARRVSVEQLWELHPDFADKVFFSVPESAYLPGANGASDGVFGHRIYTLGRGDRARGIFEHGEWRGAPRYDATSVDDGDARSSLHSPRRGLRRAVRSADRETVRYGSTDVDGPLPRKVVEHAARAFGKTVEELEGSGGGIDGM